MAQLENNKPAETTFSPAFEQHDTYQSDYSRPTTSIPLETISHCLAHQKKFSNIMTQSLHHELNCHTLSPVIDKSTWQIHISISQKQACSKLPFRQGSDPFHQVHLGIMRQPFCIGLTTATNFSAYLFIVRALRLSVQPPNCGSHKQNCSVEQIP
jgi:hypothetical protein